MTTAEVMIEADLAPDGPVVQESWLGAPALSYPRRPASVAVVLDRAVAHWPSSPAARDAAGEVGYAALADRVASTVTALHAAGLRRGDAVAVAAANSVARDTLHARGGWRPVPADRCGGCGHRSRSLSNMSMSAMPHPT